MGKTYLLSLSRDKAEKEGMLVKVTATTGIVATLYEGGHTLHSLLGIGVDDNKDASTQERTKLSKYGPKSQRAEILRKTVLLIIDEASMCAKKLFEIVHFILQDLRGSTTYFGGMIVVLAGDYLQLLPVVPFFRKEISRNGQESIVRVSLLKERPWYDSDLWKDKFMVQRLTRQMKQADDSALASMVLKVGKGLFPHSEMCLLKATVNIKEGYKHIWNWVSTKNRRDVLVNRMLIAPTTSLVNEHNERALRMFPGDEFVKYAFTTIQPIRSSTNGESDHLTDIVNPEFTCRHTPTGVPPHELRLKKGFLLWLP